MNFIDLFAGAGGLSEGFISSGFTPIAHIEMNAHASKTLETRTMYHYFKKTNNLKLYRDYQKTFHLSHKEKESARIELFNSIPEGVLEPVINKSISAKTIKSIFSEVDSYMDKINVNMIDVIIGGPPCQAYSLLGRARDTSSMENDDRNFLYKLYVQFLNYYKPKMFVFENVPGILTALNGEVYKNLQSYLKRVGYVVTPYILNSSDFGIPQNRKRIFLIGHRKDLDYNEILFEEKKYNYTINDLFEDIPELNAGEMCKSFEYKKCSTDAHTSINVRTHEDLLTHHYARPHNRRDLDIYKLVVNEWNKNHRRLKYTDLDPDLITHNNLKSFLDRFKVVAGDLSQSHTIVAHISKDGHHFIHPDIKQNRSITVRESARIQTFPDNYYFEGPRTSNYVQIGNAVPPLMSEIIAKKIKDLLI